ncbi:uncharacterized protein LOC124449688 [Xenia sp. Carnegie-2017]|uniref:uncharacterized protein LOC124449688 n=1 Tax=Xenia sp. Carnegie-2017 TaxID=2897299 RepID=UPI001F04B5CE|nr:uncharacterized protein LOC124449688 [Xenia sp. Carnegie-2017]
MPNRCIVAGCSSVPCPEKGIGLHRILFYGSEDTIKKERRKKWLDFVALKLAKCPISKMSSICSLHFKPEDFTRRYTSLQRKTSRLVFVEVGVFAFPSVHLSERLMKESAPSERNRRQIVRDILSSTEAGPCSSSQDTFGAESATSLEDSDTDVEFVDDVLRVQTIAVQAEV